MSNIVRGPGQRTACRRKSVTERLPLSQKAQRSQDPISLSVTAWVQSSPTIVSNVWQTAQIRRQYVQAMTEQGNFFAALQELQRLVIDAAADPTELAETRGLIGRVYKQQYVNAKGAPTERNRKSLERGIRAYADAYRDDPRHPIWHGINTVALLRRAERDGLQLGNVPNADTTAKDILSDIERRDLHDATGAWDFATAVGACVALDRREEAQHWAVRYAQDPSANAFEIASTLRQLTEVWQLRPETDLGKSILPILHAGLLKREGGQVNVACQSLRVAAADFADGGRFEKVFGSDAYAYLSHEWMLTYLARSCAVARIGKETARGLGTGFLIQGKDVHEKFGEEFLLLTNAHVVSDDPAVHQDSRFDGVLWSEEAGITFEALCSHRESGKTSFFVKELLWSSHPDQLDATLIRLDRPVSGVTAYPVAKRLPTADGKERVYIIGHPAGGSLSFSLHDNILLDHETPKLHYRTPTEGGSSGSPIFSGPQWRLIGIHHAGNDKMPKLNEKPGTYQANEGIWIRSIIDAIATDPAERSRQIASRKEIRDEPPLLLRPDVPGGHLCNGCDNKQ